MKKQQLTIIDGRELAIYRSQCSFCKHLIKEGLTCAAFPKGIPDNLLAGEVKHDGIIKGQVGDTIFTSES